MPAPADAPDENPRRTRLEDEVIEILMKADRPPTATEIARSRIGDARFRAQRSLSSDRGWQARAQGMIRTPLGLIVGSLLLAIAAAAVRSSLPPLALLLGLASAAMLLAVWFDRRPRPQTGPRWRGRDLDDGPRLPDLERFRQRWRSPSDR